MPVPVAQIAPQCSTQYAALADALAPHELLLSAIFTPAFLPDMIAGLVSCEAPVYADMAGIARCFLCRSFLFQRLATANQLPCLGV